MKREVVTRILAKPEAERELEYLVEYYTEKGEQNCKVLFGFAWGNDYYPGKEWPEEEISITELPRKVKSVEETGIGNIGGDDLFVYVGGLEFLFCHESDIHIIFSSHVPEIEHFFSRWVTQGFEPSEWIKDQKIGPGTRVR